MQNSSIELNNDLAKVNKKITIVEKLLNDSTKERSEIEIKMENI